MEKVEIKENEKIKEKISEETPVENKEKINKEDDIQKEIEYELLNNKSCIGKINICPKISLTELREKIMNMIPRRALFLNKDKIIEPSQEDNIKVKQIFKINSINLKYPVEGLNDTVDLEIFLNGKSYIKKEFYLNIKLKSVRINLKFDKTYKFIFKGNLLPFEEESRMTLDELCYKELKVFFIKVKDNDNDNEYITTAIKNLQKSNNIVIRKYPNNSNINIDNFDTWILIGKEKSGKTTFINCLCNYSNEVKFEDNFRYSIEVKRKIGGYEIFEFQGSLIQQKIRIIEFPGFSGDFEEDKQIKENIKKFIRTVKEVKLICFVISGNETRLTEDLKSIFSNVCNIFAIDIINNFIFIITNSDAKKPPVIDSIKESYFPKCLPKEMDSWIFKFNNSYLYELNGKDFWKVGISNFDILMNDYKKKENLSLNLTKNNIDFDFHRIANDFIVSLFKLHDYKDFYDILKNINAYDKNTNIDIPYKHCQIQKICLSCSNPFINNRCQNYQHPANYKEKRIELNKTTFQNLKNNNTLYTNCLKQYHHDLKEQLILSAFHYKELKDFYNSKLIQNSFLKNYLSEIINNNYQNKKNIIIQEINKQEKLYQEYISRNPDFDYKKFLISKLDCY